ncbi:MAG TPA: tRNA preQ1(34) S-adenosylmethionine ribosyltransferase-isomerase QueA [Methylocella sp.]|nr:tRNA preQ1(34) S-adenosylmethionine ribosyltransferase-isomerase QueA [Methylocella sp.]
MRVECFDFDLPANRIALRPVEPRDQARLLIVRPGGEPLLQDSVVSALPNFLAPGDILAVNDTRVIPSCLIGSRRRGAAVARIAVTLIRREGEMSWRALARPAKKLKQGEVILFALPSGEQVLEAAVVSKGDDGEILLAFTRSGNALDKAIERIGLMPLPPYITQRRASDAWDLRDYQTLFAAKPGAVAAPTASLHFTPPLIDVLKQKGIFLQKITLHVGAGTFLPVKASNTEGHTMHPEWGEVTQAAADSFNRARAAGGRIIAIGTTSLRLLESAARPDGAIAPFRGETAIFITPGYHFKAADVLLTNFHLPRSTLFMLAAAFSGLETVHEAYQHAIAQYYRFYSYGDACLLYPATGKSR